MKVKVAPENRKFVRFLWNNNGRIETYEYTNQAIGARDPPCLASYALRKNARDNKEQLPDALKYRERKFYIDELNVSSISLESVQKILQGMKNVLS